MQSPKVSIITVTYNVENTIEQTIESVLGQTYRNIEYILVDGMSTDSTWTKICKYRDRVSCIIHEADKGLYDAMNKGIEKATGDIIGIINGDDWYERDAVKTIVREVQDSDADIFYGDMYIVDSGGTSVQVGRRDVENLWVDMIAHPAVFVKSEVYTSYGKFNLDYPLVADYEMMLRFYIKGVKFKRLDCVLANFRKGGLTTRKQLACAKEVKQVSLSYIDKCPEPAKYLKLINRKYAASCLKCIYGQEDIIFKNALKAEVGNDDLAVFGAGKMGRKFVEKIDRCGFRIACIIDNDIKKRGTYIDEIRVETPDILENWNGDIMIAAIDYCDIFEQLSKMDNKNMHIIDISKLYQEE